MTHHICTHRTEKKMRKSDKNVIQEIRKQRLVFDHTSYVIYVDMQIES